MIWSKHKKMICRKICKKNGFTLLEAIIALALWLILSVGIFAIWQHTTHISREILARQNAFENARVSMDALLMNLQMAQAIHLEVDSNNILRTLTLTARNPQGLLHDYTFRFDINAPIDSARYNRLIFGLHNEFASNIASVRIEFVNDNRMSVTIQTACKEPIIITGSVDVRYKTVVVTIF